MHAPLANTPTAAAVNDYDVAVMGAANIFKPRCTTPSHNPSPPAPSSKAIGERLAAA